MSDSRPPVKLDFMSPIANLPPRQKSDPETTAASVGAAQEVGFLTKEPPAKLVDKIDGRSLRKRGPKTQLNLKIFEEEKAMILQSAEVVMDNPESGIRSVGEFVVRAVEMYRSLKPTP